MPSHPRRRRRRPEPVAASDVLSRFRRRSGAPAAGGAVGRLAAAWPGVVGAAVAAHSAPMRCTRAGVVSVACSSSSWAHELSARREDLLERLVAACPDSGVTGLRFSVADHAFGGAGEATPRPPLAPSPTRADRAAGEALAEGVKDARVRELVARAAAAAAARQSRPSGR